MEENECVICLETLNDNKEILRCNHELHKECKNKLIGSKCPSKNKCPICRLSFEERVNNGDNIIQSSRSSPNQISPIGYERRQIPLPIVQAMLFSIPSPIN